MVRMGEVSMRRRVESDETGTEPNRGGKRAWAAPRVVRHGAFREFTQGAASGSMADPMFGGAVGSGMN